MKMFALVLFAAIQTATAQVPDRPQVMQEQRGNISNIHVEGSLAATRQLDCLALSDVTSAFTPADLHTGILRCIQQGQFDKEARLFLLSGVYAKFDAMRVADRSAQGGPKVLIMRTFAGLSDEEKAQHVAATQQQISGAALPALCADIAKIGPPTYFPRYLVLHGLNAYMSKTPLENALKPDFDAAATWEGLLASYLHCPK
ncbi:MAG: hypothetical protein ACJ8GW_10100 [Massilia sp.]